MPSERDNAAARKRRNPATALSVNLWHCLVIHIWRSSFGSWKWGFPNVTTHCMLLSTQSPWNHIVVLSHSQTTYTDEWATLKQILRPPSNPQTLTLAVLGRYFRVNASPEGSSQLLTEEPGCKFLFTSFLPSISLCVRPLGGVDVQYTRVRGLNANGRETSWVFLDKQ